MSSLSDVRHRIRAQVVGRERELTLLLAAVAAGRDILLEGPPGTSKTTLLKAITAEWGIPLVFVEGNADLTPAKLVGYHNPARVLREGYTADNFVDGPLLEAMRGGGFLYIEEFNRAPEDTLNTLLTAMADRRIAVPRVGAVVARDTFRVVASMNPYDNIGTTRLSTSVHDRFNRLAITYQDEQSERGIVALRAPVPDLDRALYTRLVADAVALTRATRAHQDIRQGASVRGAIDLTLVAGQLLTMDAERPDAFHSAVPDRDPVGRDDQDEKYSGSVSPGQAEAGFAGEAGNAASTPGRDGADADSADGDGEKAYRETVYDAMIVALSGRIFLDETVELTPEQVLRQIWEDHYILNPAAASPG